MEIVENRDPAATLALPLLGHTKSVGSWRFVIHYRWCGSYRRGYYNDSVVSPGMLLKVCHYCRPSEAEISRYLPSVGIYVHAHGYGAGRAATPPELET